MELKEFFLNVGGNYEDAIQRLMSERIVRKFLLKFIDEPSYSEMKASLAAGDIATAFRAAHTLKGTAANLGLDDLCKAASELTEQLRGASALPPKEYVEAVDEVYKSTIESISLLSLQ